MENFGEAPVPAFSHIDLKLKRLASMVSPIIGFRCARWPWTASIAAKLDQVQRRMISIIVPLRKEESETSLAFTRRKQRIVSLMINHTEDTMLFPMG